jgi:SAM-dependent methyltransferase
MTTAKQDAWYRQWSAFTDEEYSLFYEWIAPASIEDFTAKDVLEGGCGGGQHTLLVAPVAKSVTAVDLNTIEIARKRNSNAKNITFVEGDLAKIDLKRQFDVVFCIGVIHHTDDPGLTFENLYRHLAPGGKMIIWTYSAEGNTLMRFGVEPLRKLFFSHLPKSALALLAKSITVMLYLPVYSIYRISVFRTLPYFDYFKKFRELSLQRNVLNVFDKLNAPQTHFITLKRCQVWFNEQRFEPETISIRYHAGVSYSLVGTKRLVHPSCSENQK